MLFLTLNNADTIFQCKSRCHFGECRTIDINVVPGTLMLTITLYHSSIITGLVRIVTEIRADASCRAKRLITDQRTIMEILKWNW